MQFIPLDHEQIRSLGQIGVMAARDGSTDCAEAIFAAIAMTHPDRALPYAGLTLAKLYTGAADQALVAVERGLARVRSDDRLDLQALRAFVLSVDRRSGRAREALQEAAGHPLADAMTSQRAGLPVPSRRF